MAENWQLEVRLGYIVKPYVKNGGCRKGGGGVRRGRKRKIRRRRWGSEEAAMAVTKEKSEVCISFQFSFQFETK